MELMIDWKEIIQHNTVEVMSDLCEKVCKILYNMTQKTKVLNYSITL